MSSRGYEKEMRKYRKEHAASDHEQHPAHYYSHELHHAIGGACNISVNQAA